MNNNTQAPNLVTPTQTIDISGTETITHAGRVDGVKPSWQGSDGWSRQRQIEQERKKEMEAHAQRMQDANPMSIRLLKLEAAVGQLQKELKALKSNATSA